MLLDDDDMLWEVVDTTEEIVSPWLDQVIVPVSASSSSSTNEEIFNPWLDL